MRMWLVNPKLMCDKHLLGEHVEMHMFVGAINKGKSIDGYIKNGLIDTEKLKIRHDLLVEEMLHRGMNHNSPLEYEDKLHVKSISINKSFFELICRCTKCQDKYIKFTENKTKEINLFLKQ